MSRLTRLGTIARSGADRVPRCNVSVSVFYACSRRSGMSNNVIDGARSRQLLHISAREFAIPLEQKNVARFCAIDSYRRR
ncbi:hypothetical protein PUN28_017383 [Cardiocondyla obscurior]|uniref:Ribosomal protein S14 n=1 Tax=Cardiocondyla obscurior TaxID=286306 RepID=A0AAW2EQH1_9HYME